MQPYLDVMELPQITTEALLYSSLSRPFASFPSAAREEWKNPLRPLTSPQGALHQIWVLTASLKGPPLMPMGGLLVVFLPLVTSGFRQLLRFTWCLGDCLNRPTVEKLKALVGVSQGYRRNTAETVETRPDTIELSYKPGLSTTCYIDNFWPLCSMNLSLFLGLA